MYLRIFYPIWVLGGGWGGSQGIGIQPAYAALKPCNLFPNLIPAEVYSLTLVPMDTEAQALIQMIDDILDH